MQLTLWGIAVTRGGVWGGSEKGRLHAGHRPGDACGLLAQSAALLPSKVHAAPASQQPNLSPPLAMLTPGTQTTRCCLATPASARRSSPGCSSTP